MRAAPWITLQYQFKSARRYGALVRQVLMVAHRTLRLPRSLELAVIFIGDKPMRVLNRRYRGKNKTTNVLAFETGDIFIAIPEAKREAKKYGWTMGYEIARLALHGFLHLLGYDHAVEKEAEVMEKIERRVLRHVE